MAYSIYNDMDASVCTSTYSSLYSDPRPSDKALTYLTNLLSDHIKKYNWFQKQIMADITKLKEEMSQMHSSITALAGVIQTSTRPSQVTDFDERFDIAIGGLRRLQTKLLDQQNSLDDNLHITQYSVLQHIKEVNSKVNLLAGPWTCGGTPGWRRVGFFNMSNASESCPSGWQAKEYSGKRLCSRTSLSIKTCDSTNFSVGEVLYSKVCGKIVGYQFGGTVAFLSSHEKYARSINDAYVDGVSITYSHPRKHIWTFAAGGTELNRGWVTTCPCDANTTIYVPWFVGTNYFCESGNNNVWEDNYEIYADDPLWDGKKCSPSSKCCSLNSPPYFTKYLPSPTSEDIEVRLCGYTVPTYANVLLELMEIYVQ